MKQKSLAIFRSAMFLHEVGGKLTVWSDRDSGTGNIGWEHSHLPRPFKLLQIHTQGFYCYTPYLIQRIKPLPYKKIGRVWIPFWVHRILMDSCHPFSRTLLNSCLHWIYRLRTMISRLWRPQNFHNLPFYRKSCETEREEEDSDFSLKYQSTLEMQTGQLKANTERTHIRDIQPYHVWGESHWTSRFRVSKWHWTSEGGAQTTMQFLFQWPAIYKVWIYTLTLDSI